MRTDSAFSIALGAVGLERFTADRMTPLLMRTRSEAFFVKTGASAAEASKSRRAPWKQSWLAQAPKKSEGLRVPCNEGRDPSARAALID